MLKFLANIIKFLYKNLFLYKDRQPFLQKSLQFLVKVIKFSPKNHKNFLTKIAKCFWKNCQINSQKLLNFLVKIVRFSSKNHKISLKNLQIFLQKTLNFSAKIFKLFCNHDQLYLELLTLRVRSEKQRSKRLGGKGLKIDSIISLFELID